MKWIRKLNSGIVSTMTIEERGELLTGIVCLMEGIPFEKKLTGTAAYAMGMLQEEKHKEELKAEKCSAAGKKGGGNPRLYAKKVGRAAKKKTEPSSVKPEVEERTKIKEESPESVIAGYPCGNELKDALRDFLAMRTRIRKPVTVKAMKLLLNQLEKLARDEQTKLTVVNQSVMNCWQGFYAARPERAEYGPNGVKLKPESEQLHDLDDLF